MSDRDALTAWCLGCGAVRPPWELMQPCPNCGNPGAYFTYKTLEEAIDLPHDVGESP